MTYEETIDWIAELFEEDRNDIYPERSRDEIEAWDSLGMLTLMSGFFEKFDIKLTDDEVDSLKTVNDILNILKQYAKLD
jgi:acyl carrier protein